MYLEFYNFHQKPFQINTDPKLYWFGDNNTDAFKLFASVLTDSKGISVLTGASGTGKTTFINLLISTLPSSYITGITHDPSFSELEFSRYLAHVFSLQTDFDSLKEFYILFREFLFDAHNQNKSVLLVVDEAQKLTPEILNIIITLSEIKYKKTPILSVILAGQNDSHFIFMETENKSLKTIINVNHQLHYLSETETNDYIQFRLYASGIREELFTKGALKKIFTLSNGSPHKINIIADYALLSGYINESRHIDESLVDVLTNSVDIHQTDMDPVQINSTRRLNFSSQKSPLLNFPDYLNSPEIPDRDSGSVSHQTDTVSQNVFRFHSQDLRVLKQMARFYIENKNLTEAELYIEKILQSKEMVTDTLMMKGEIHILKKEYENAIDIFNQILSRDPMNVHSYYFKALAHMENKELTIAKAALGTALSINPKFNKGKSLLEKINTSHPVKA